MRADDYKAVITILKVSYIVVIGIIFQVISLFIYSRRKSQIILNRSPFIMLISLYLTFFYAICNNLIYLFEGTFSVYLTSLTCSIFTFNTNVSVWIIIFCYFLRAIRLHRVYNIISNEKVARTKERFYIKSLIIFSVLFLALYLIMIHIDFTSKYIIDKLSNCLTESSNEYSDQHYIYTIISMLVKLAVMITGIWKMKSLKDKFFIRREISSVFLCIIAIELINCAFCVFDPKNLSISRILYQNILFVVVLYFSGILIVIQSFKVNQIPVCNVTESAKCFNLMINSPYSFNAFYKFLKANYVDGAILLVFYMRVLILIEKFHGLSLKVSYNTSQETSLRRFLNDTIQMFLKQKESKFEVKIDHFYIIDLDKKTGQDLIAQLKMIGSYCLYHLDTKYFSKFVTSEQIEPLIKELTREEIVFTRLCMSSELDYNLTDYEFN